MVGYLADGEGLLPVLDDSFQNLLTSAVAEVAEQLALIGACHEVAQGE